MIPVSNPHWSAPGSARSRAASRRRMASARRIASTITVSSSRARRCRAIARRSASSTHRCIQPAAARPLVSLSEPSCAPTCRSLVLCAEAALTHPHMSTRGAAIVDPSRRGGIQALPEIERGLSRGRSVRRGCKAGPTSTRQGNPLKNSRVVPHDGEALSFQHLSRLVRVDQRRVENFP